jgi:hypothetical protein
VKGLSPVDAVATVLSDVSRRIDQEMLLDRVAKNSARSGVKAAAFFKTTTGEQLKMAIVTAAAQALIRPAVTLQAPTNPLVDRAVRAIGSTATPGLTEDQWRAVRSAVNETVRGRFIPDALTARFREFDDAGAHDIGLVYETALRGYRDRLPQLSDDERRAAVALLDQISAEEADAKKRLSRQDYDALLAYVSFTLNTDRRFKSDHDNPRARFQAGYGADLSLRVENQFAENAAVLKAWRAAAARCQSRNPGLADALTVIRDALVPYAPTTAGSLGKGVLFHPAWWYKTEQRRSWWEGCVAPLLEESALAVFTAIPGAYPLVRVLFAGAHLFVPVEPGAAPRSWWRKLLIPTLISSVSLAGYTQDMAAGAVLLGLVAHVSTSLSARWVNKKFGTPPPGAFVRDLLTVMPGQSELGTLNDLSPETLLRQAARPSMMDKGALARLLNRLLDDRPLASSSVPGASADQPLLPDDRRRRIATFITGQS